MRWLVLFAMLGACTDDSSTPADFEVHVTATWSTMSHPEVIGVQIDGAPLADGATYSAIESFESYAIAVRSFAPKSAVVTTTAGSQSSLLELSTCSQLDQVKLKSLGRLTQESDHYIVGVAGTFEWDSGTCTGVDGSVGAITRRARTR